MIKWNDPKTNPPPIGKHIIATDGEFTGEAYIAESGGIKYWLRYYGVPWERFSHGRPVTGWKEMPE